MPLPFPRAAAKFSRRGFVTIAAMLATVGRAGAARAGPAPASVDSRLAAAIASPSRSAFNVARDRYRHPYEVLRFFGLRDDLSVLEIEPGAGYWTEILAPYLKAHGQYAVAIPKLPGERKAIPAYIAHLQAKQASFGQVAVLAFENTLPTDRFDLILSFRNLHDWMADGTAGAKLRAIYGALKPAGIFGIEDHRGLADQPQDPKAKSGYVREDYAVNLIEQAGFRLVARSAVGDNPRDTKNYPAGVWTLPPVLRLGATGRAKYLAIGESDRWTLKFTRT